MRTNRSNGRKVSNRRAHRPDQRIYRTLRLNRKRRGGGAIIGWLTFVGLTVVLGVWWLVRR